MFKYVVLLIDNLIDKRLENIINCLLIILLLMKQKHQFIEPTG